MKNNKIVWSMSFLYAFIFMGGGSIATYLSLYYADLHIGKTSIGFLTSLGAVMAVAGKPLWGSLTDRATYKNTMLLVSLMCSAGSIWLIPSFRSEYWGLAAATAIFFFFQTAVNPISDSIALELASKQYFRFSTIRMFGSVGFALISGLMGWLIDIRIGLIFPVFSAFILCAFALSFAIPKVEGHQHTRKVKFVDVFKNQRLLYIYVYVLLIEVTFGYFAAFHSIYTVQQGISKGLLGIGVMIGSFSQFPFMMWFDKWYQKYGMVRIILFSGVIHIIRWLIYWFALNPVTLIACWVLHGGTFILLYLCLAQYVNDHIDKELKASGQMMNSIILTGAGRFIGGVAGGALATAFGYGNVFAVAAAICVMATGGFWWFTRTSGLFRDCEKGISTSY